MEIFSTIYSSPIGLLHIQSNDQSIMSVAFVSEANDIAAQEHPLITLCMTQLKEYFNGGRRVFELPFAQHGSSFQQNAWSLLHAVPYGKTISYLTMAKQHGNVKAIRALASANGKNKIAIIVPCHRVIGSNQSLTGYAGGLWRKQWLLEHEAKCSGREMQLGMFS